MLEGITRAKQDRHRQGRGRLHRAARAACTATPRSPARASSPRRSTCRSCAATAPAARSTSSSTTRSASPPSPAAVALVVLLHRRRPDDPGADLPRERRRPRGRASGSRELAFEYRQAFKKDVVIDMVCYRRRGHNEGDDPSMTQPLMYNLIEAKRSVRKLYTESLIGRGDITVEEAEQALRDYQGQLERVFTETREADRRRRRTRAPAGPRARRPSRATSVGAPHGRPPSTSRSSSGSPTRTSTLPDGFTVHPKLMPLLQRRAAMAVRGRHRLGDGRAVRVRLAAARGHAGPAGRPGHAGAARSCSGTPCSPTGRPATSGRRWRTSTRTRPGSGSTTRCCREFAAMGFEYGYSVARPDALVLWEAQFGDFVNGAQTIIDEFISSSEQKWGQRSSRRAAAAARLRGPGPGPLLRPHRALPADVRRGQHDGRHARRPRRRTSTCCAGTPTTSRAGR